MTQLASFPLGLDASGGSRCTGSQPAGNSKPSTRR